MKLKATPYQHFKGGHYLVYGDIQPLPSGLHTSKYSFIAKESEQTNEVEVIVTKNGIFYSPFSDETMTLYFSEKTGEWWLRPSEEFHGDKIHEDGTKVQRFSQRKNEEPATIVLSLTEYN